jgi:hypothetical protein
LGVHIDDSDGSHAARLARYTAVANALAVISDRGLGDLVDAAPSIGSGIGGTRVGLDVEGVPVFAKRIPLTDLERRPDHVMSTANLFDLPTFMQYGVGSPGFGVWRELAAHVMTTNWVLGGRCESFPLMYHWRVLERRSPRPPSSAEHAEITRTIEFWGGSPPVRERFEQIARACADVVVFLEYVPDNLYTWLAKQLTGDAGTADAACAMLERRLRADVAFMNANGLLHFDAHFGNILTEGRRLYFADFGLATSSRFELTGAESTFLDRHRSHDACHTMTELVNRIVTGLTGTPAPDRAGLLERCVDGREPLDLPPAAAAIVRRYAPVALVVNRFYGRLRRESRAVEYPAEEIEARCADLRSPWRARTRPGQ